MIAISRDQTLSKLSLGNGEENAMLA